MNGQEELAQAIASAERAVDLAQAVNRLKQNKDFMDVFHQKFVVDWALTQMSLVGTMSMDQRRGYVEQAMARGVFTDFIDDITESGRMALDGLAELKDERDEEGK